MQRVAALYDIHGNLPALEAVLAEVAGSDVDAIVVGGDVVPGPMPRECLDRLHATGLPTHFIHGNGESAAREVFAGRVPEKVPEAFRPVVQWSAEQVPDEYRQAIAGWPSTLRLVVDGLGDVLFCHATARNDTELVTRLSPESRFREVFAGVERTVVICGHTHMQFDRTVDTLRVVNAGSVGMPFGEPGAHWLLLGPDVQAFVERQILHPPSEEQMLAAYAKVDGRECTASNPPGASS